MNIDSLVNYIKMGTNMSYNAKNTKILVLGAGIVTLLGGAYSGILGGYYRYVCIFMIASFLICSSIVFILLSQKVSIKTMLIIQLLISVNWILQILLLQTIIFSNFLGWNIKIVLLYLPIILIPSIFGLINNHILKKGYLFSEHKLLKGVTFGGVYGYIGVNIARSLNMSQQSAIYMTLICFSLVCSFISLGLLNIQRLHYLNKYNKRGILSENLFDTKEK